MKNLTWIALGVGATLFAAVLLFSSNKVTLKAIWKDGSEIILDVSPPSH